MIETIIDVQKKLLEAAKICDLDKIEEALTASGEELDTIINIQDKNGRTPLHLAVMSNMIDINKKCNAIERLTSVPTCRTNIKDNEGYTPLYSSVVRREGIEVVIALTLTRDFDPNQTDEEKRTVLHQAASQGNITLIHLFAHKKCDIKAEDRDGNTPLQIANANDNFDAMKVLLEHYYSRNVMDEVIEIMAVSPGYFD